MGAGSPCAYPRQPHARAAPFARLQVRRCTSFVIACQAHPTTKRNGITCLGDLTQQQMTARMTHLLPLVIQKSIAYQRIWVRRPPRRPAPPIRPPRSPVPPSRPSSQLHVFARGMDGAIWHKPQHRAPNGSRWWNDWASIGGDTRLYTC